MVKVVKSLSHEKVQTLCIGMLLVPKLPPLGDDGRTPRLCFYFATLILKKCVTGKQYPNESSRRSMWIDLSLYLVGRERVGSLPIAF